MSTKQSKAIDIKVDKDNDVPTNKLETSGEKNISTMASTKINCYSSCCGSRQKMVKK
jgi:hypothetical protein